MHHYGVPWGATVPLAPSSVTICPSVTEWVAVCVPLTAGMPYSRATMAAWESCPPVSATTAAASAKRGV